MHTAAYLVAQYSRHEQRRMLKVILIFKLAFCISQSLGVLSLYWILSRSSVMLIIGTRGKVSTLQIFLLIPQEGRKSKA
jgi:ABC-type branched-subunit amino acid transport system permease subunit